MKATMLIPTLFLATACGGQTADANAQAAMPGVALPAAGAADAVRTAKPGTAPAPGAMLSPTPTASASAPR